MIWTTWENVGIDRIACAWLIKKYIDTDAVFNFIEYGSQITEEMGIAFDIPGSKYSHRRGRCTFSTLLKEYELKDPTLEEIAKIIDGVDGVNDMIPAPEAYGLEAICIGIRKYSEDDHKAIENGRLIFEGLYAYLFNK